MYLSITRALVVNGIPVEDMLGRVRGKSSCTRGIAYRVSRRVCKGKARRQKIKKITKAYSLTDRVFTRVTCACVWFDFIPLDEHLNFLWLLSGTGTGI